MTTLYGSIRLRPTRIGFLVSPTNMGQVRRIMQVCTCLWGGVFNPIIPVCEELPEPWSEDSSRTPTSTQVTRGYLDFFEPDVFVESETGLAARAQIADLRLSYGEPRVVSLDAFFDPREPRRSGESPVPFGLTVLDVYKELYDRQFQFVRRHDSRVVLFDSSTKHEAFIEAGFGGFPPQGFLAPLAKAYRDAFDPLQLQPSADAWIKVAKESYATPLRFTMYTIKRDPDGYSDPVFFVADPNSPLDLIDLWNLRQFASPVLPISNIWASEARDTIREFVTANYRPLRGNPHGVMIHTTVQFGRSFSEERAKELAFSLLDGLPSESWSYHRWYERIWCLDRTQDRVMRPRRARLSAAESDIEFPVADEQKQRSVRFRSLAPRFASLYGDDKARWANVLRLHAYATDESTALVLPSDTPQQTVAQMRLGGDGAIVSREGLILPQHFKNHPEFVHLLSGAQLFGQYLEARGSAAKPSDPGQRRIVMHYDDAARNHPRVKEFQAGQSASVETASRCTRPNRTSSIPRIAGTRTAMGFSRVPLCAHVSCSTDASKKPFTAKPQPSSAFDLASSPVDAPTYFSYCRSYPAGKIARCVRRAALTSRGAMVKVRISCSYDNFNDGRKEGAGLSTKETISSRIKFTKLLQLF